MPPNCPHGALGWPCPLAPAVGDFFFKGLGPNSSVATVIGVQGPHTLQQGGGQTSESTGLNLILHAAHLRLSVLPTTDGIVQVSILVVAKSDHGGKQEACDLSSPLSYSIFSG